ncbi:MAG: alkaline phosphatase family protein [Candidatus Cybelea sp.]
MRLSPALLLVVAAGCNSIVSTPSPSSRTFDSGAVGLRTIARPGTFTNGKISHVVIIVQENRSPDDLFYGLKGADTQPYGTNSAGTRINLTPESLTAPYDLSHTHDAYAVESDSGKMDGFSMERESDCKKNQTCPKGDVASYGYVPRKEVQPYFDMAEQYGFADHLFETNEGPSLPAHQYLISGTSTLSATSSLRASENAYNPDQKFAGGCDSPKGSLGLVIDQNGQELQETYPCYDRPTLMDLLAAKGLTWRYYVWKTGPGLWNAPDAILHIEQGSQFSTEVVAPPSKVLTDISSGDLASVVWVTPTAKASDHAYITNGTGPSWVTSVVNAVGESSYWDSTAIFLVWDDWGGWYDHVSPVVYNSYELGFRVPGVVISAYTPRGCVSHRQHEFGSILKFAEKTFGLGSLGTTDARADDFSDCFNFKRAPRAFTPIAAPLGRDYFLKQPPGNESPDDDN